MAVQPGDVDQFMDPQITAAMSKGAIPAAAKQGLIAKYVAQARAAISFANRVPLTSDTTLVPPEGVPHICVMVVQAMSGGAPQLAAYCESWSFKSLRDAAKDWLEECRKGRVSYPGNTLDPAQTPTGFWWGDFTGQPGLLSASIYAAGTGYTVGDILWLSGGSGQGASAAVVSINGTGGVMAVSISSAGNYLTAPPTPNPVTGGTGAGAVLAVVIGNVQQQRIDMSTDGPFQTGSIQGP